MKGIIKKTSNICTILLMLFANIILCIIFYIDKFLGRVGFYQTIHLLLNTKINDQGTITVLLSGVEKCLPLFLILSLLEILLFVRRKKFKIILFKNIELIPGITAKYRFIFAVIFFCLSIFISLRYLKYDEYIKTLKSETNIYEKYYVDTNKVQIRFNDQKKNLVLIYLESMESTLFSKENNGSFKESRIPELEELAMNNINFSHTNGLGGRYNSETSTIATLISSTSSTPVQHRIKSISDANHIMEDVRTLSDVLKANNYHLEFIQGSDINFGNTDTYLYDHGYVNILDYTEAKKRNYIEEDYHVWWGYEDAKLFEFAKQEINQLASQEEPFAITLFTLDTHFLDGYLDSSCDTPYSDKMSNVYHCSSKMTNEFVQWIQKQEFYEDTMIVILGDHLTYQESYFKNNKNRYVYNVFINAEFQDVNTNNRIFTNYDVYPTILSGLGATIEGNKIGFGVNLFSEEKTLPEKIGYDYFTSEIEKHSKYYDNNLE